MLERARESELRLGVVLELQRQQPDGIGGLRIVARALLDLAELLARLGELALGGELPPELHAHFLRSRIGRDERLVELDHVRGRRLAQDLRLQDRRLLPRGLDREGGIGLVPRNLDIARDERGHAHGVMRLGNVGVGRRDFAGRLEDRRLVGELAQQVRNLHEERTAARVLFQDAAERVARLREVALVGEQRRHDLAGERGFRVELEEKRRAVQRGAERAGANRRQ